MSNDQGQSSRNSVCRHPLATRPLLYTDSIKGEQVCRDDMWVVTTEELNALLSERGAMSASAALRQLRRELKQHWLTGIACDPDLPRHTYRTRSTCYCSTWRSPPMATVGGALEAWIYHLYEKAGFAGLDEELPQPDEQDERKNDA